MSDHPHNRESDQLSSIETTSMVNPPPIRNQESVDTNRDTPTKEDEITIMKRNVLKIMSLLSQHFKLETDTSLATYKREMDELSSQMPSFNHTGEISDLLMRVETLSDRIAISQSSIENEQRIVVESLENRMRTHFENHLKLTRNLHQLSNLDQWRKDVNQIIGDDEVTGDDALKIIALSLDHGLSNWLHSGTCHIKDFHNKSLKDLIKMVGKYYKEIRRPGLLAKEAREDIPSTPYAWELYAQKLDDIPVDHFKFDLLFNMMNGPEKKAYRARKWTLDKSYKWFLDHCDPTNKQPKRKNQDDDDKDLESNKPKKKKKKKKKKKHA